MESSAYRFAEPAPSAQSGGAPPGASDLVLRRLSTSEDYERAVELQRLTWGSMFRDVVPAAILKVSQRVGGVAAGAFAPNGELQGFVYGLTGFYDHRLVHWSHMLAVRPGLRDHGIGRQLKEFQRALLRETGVGWMYWTFDPLVARNAHLNLNRLGVEVREYVPDMYGDTGSDLHAFGTDRFVVACAVEAMDASALERADRSSATESAPILNDFGASELTRAIEDRQLPWLRIEIPADIEAAPVTEARAWRAATRPGFLAALHAGYQVSGFVRIGSRYFYVLSSADSRHSAAE